MDTSLSLFILNAFLGDKPDIKAPSSFGLDMLIKSPSLFLLKIIKNYSSCYSKIINSHTKVKKIIKTFSKSN